MWVRGIHFQVPGEIHQSPPKSSNQIEGGRGANACAVATPAPRQRLRLRQRRRQRTAKLQGELWRDAGLVTFFVKSF